MITTTPDERRVSYSERGHGAPVVLVHGSACSAAHWAGVGERLAADHRVIALDLHGHGSTDAWAGDGPLSLADEAALVGAVAAAAGEPVHLVGHSYGGAVALRFALERPRTVRTLTLIEPVAFHLLGNGYGPDAALLGEVESVAGALLSATARGDYASAMGAFVDYWNGAGAWQRLGRDARRALGAYAHTVCTHFAAATGERVPLAAYGRLAMPALIVQGARTRRPAARVSELLAGAMAHARHQVVPEAGHMLPLTHACDVSAAIGEHASPSSRAA